MSVQSVRLAATIGHLFTRTAIVVACGAMAVAQGGCKKEPCIDKSKPALEQCQTDLDSTQKQLNELKVTLAQALANPGTIQVDPSVLMINGKRVEAKVQEGTLTQQQVLSVLRSSKGSLRDCYTRALKRNSSLHHGSITLTVSFKVKNNGSPSGISVRPNRDAQMIHCMVRAINRWTFPRFQGQPVGVESPLTLTPKE